HRSHSARWLATDGSLPPWPHPLFDARCLRHAQRHICKIPPVPAYRLAAPIHFRARAFLRVCRRGALRASLHVSSRAVLHVSLRASLERKSACLAHASHSISGEEHGNTSWSSDRSGNPSNYVCAHIGCDERPRCVRPTVYLRGLRTTYLLAARALLRRE